MGRVRAYGERDLQTIGADFHRMAGQRVSEEAAMAEMIEISSRPILFTTLRFGEHKGKRIEEVARTDRGYL